MLVAFVIMYKLFSGNVSDPFAKFEFFQTKRMVPVEKKTSFATAMILQKLISFFSSSSYSKQQQLRVFFVVLLSILAKVQLMSCFAHIVSHTHNSKQHKQCMEQLLEEEKI